MLVCHCNGVSDRRIRKAIREGAASVRAVSVTTGAGACCGGCIQTVEKILHVETHQLGAAQEPTVLPLAPQT